MAKNKTIKTLSAIALSAVATSFLLGATAYADTTLPSYVNSVESGYVTSVKSQGK